MAMALFIICLIRMLTLIVRQPTFQTGRVDIPTFNPDDYIGIATSITNGNLTLHGTTNLGTIDNPGIWYVDGDLDFRGTVEGYGIFIVTGVVNFHGNITVNGLDTDGSNVAFYSQGGVEYTR